MLQKIVSISLFIFISLNAYAHKGIAFCNPNQLKIHSLAVDYPGMTQANLLYGIINHGKSACAIPSGLNIWGVESNGNEVKLNMAQITSARNNQPIYISPLKHKDYINSSKLVWFSLHSSHNEEQLFYKVKVKLPQLTTSQEESSSLTNDNTAYSSSLNIVNPITRGYLYRWVLQLGGDTCPYKDGRSNNYFNIKKSKPNQSIKVYFNITASCG